MTVTEPTTATVTLDEPNHRYEIAVDGTVIGLIDFVRRGDVLDFHHTEVAPSYEGRGFGAHLVGRALDDVRARGLTVRPTCSFVRAYVRRHPDVADLVAS
jgi:uncharacterized protein